MRIIPFLDKAYRVMVLEKRLPISWVSRYHELMYKKKLDDTLEEFSCLPPSPCPENAAAELHMLTCTRDILMAIASVKSLMLYQPNIKVVFHGDATIEESHSAILKNQFPGCTVVLLEEANRRIAADQRISKLRAGIGERFSLGEGYERQRAAWALKVFDFYLLSSSEKVIVLDSDTLFLKPPKELMSWIDSDSVSAFYSQPSGSNFRVNEEIFHSLFPDSVYIRRFNGGLFGYSKKTVTYNLIVDVVEKILEESNFPVFGDECIWRVILSNVKSAPLEFKRYPLIANSKKESKSLVDGFGSNYVHFIIKHRGGYYASVARQILDRIKRDYDNGEQSHDRF